MIALEQRRLARAARAHDGHDLSRSGGDRGIEPERVSLDDDAGVECGAGHRGVSGRQARTSSSTAIAVTSSSSERATAVPCETPDPLNAV